MNVNFSDYQQAQATLKEMVDAMVQEFLQPTENGLIERSEWHIRIPHLWILYDRWSIVILYKVGVVAVSLLMF